jgi:alkylation response protein AidB-like acyl-CoA dehydrogenase/putative flippase GtrA
VPREANEPSAWSLVPLLVILGSTLPMLVAEISVLERYHALMAAIVRRLPFGLSRIVAPSFLGFAIINGFTFSVDLGLLTLCHGVLKWPYPAAVTLSYLTAFALSFVLNRALNFRSHEAPGPQTTKYVVAVGINYAAFVLGVGEGLTAVGVEYQLARILSGLCEGVYMYSVMRWVVFRDAPRGLRLGAASLAPRRPGGLSGYRGARINHDNPSPKAAEGTKDALRARRRTRTHGQAAAGPGRAEQASPARPGSARHAARRGAARLSPAAGGTGGPATQTRPHRRGGSGIPGRSRTRRQPARTSLPAQEAHRALILRCARRGRAFHWPNLLLAGSMVGKPCGTVRGGSSGAAMSHYKSNLRDIEFNLFEVLRRQDLLGEPPYAELDEETARGMLAEVDRLAKGPLAESFADADRNPPAFDPVTNSVRVPESLRRSYRAFMDAEWWRLSLPGDLGGTLAPRSLAWAMAELILGSNPPVWMYASGHSMARALWELGTDDQKRFARLAIDREWGGTMVLTEPDAGSDVGAGRTKAIAQPDGTWHIEGVKRFITSAEHDLADNIFHLVLARPEGRGPGTKGLSMFLVPKHLVGEDGSLGERNGVVATNVEHKMGLKASTTCELTFGAGRPAVGTLVGGVHDGIRQMFRVIEEARMMVGTKAIATLSTGYLNALDFAMSRLQGADMTQMTDRTAPRVTIIHHPDVRRMLMLQKAYAEGMRALVLYTATLQDALQVAAEQGRADEATARLNDLLLPVVKGVGSERSYEMLTLSLQTLGGSGYLQDYPIEQYIRDAKIDSLYEGTTGIQSNDLFFRKIIRDNGKAFGALLGKVKDFAAAEGGNGRLKAERAMLAEAAGHVEAIATAMTGFLTASATAPAEIYKVGLNTSRLLMALGDLVIGWLLLVQADIAQRRLDETTRGADRDFYAGKLAAARFFAATVLPRLAAERRIAEETSLDLMDLPEAAF